MADMLRCLWLPDCQYYLSGGSRWCWVFLLYRQ